MILFKRYAIQVIRGEKKSRLPISFWGNYLCLKLEKHGIWFWYKGDEVLYLWPWARKNHGRGKFISLLASGTGEWGDAQFHSLKELDEFWEKCSTCNNENTNTDHSII
jgi:hypothetical protein